MNSDHQKRSEVDSYSVENFVPFLSDIQRCVILNFERFFVLIFQHLSLEKTIVLQKDSDMVKIPVFILFRDPYVQLAYDLMYLERDRTVIFDGYQT